MSTFKRKQRFDLVKRKADGKIIKWEQKRLSELGILPPKEAEGPTPFDHLVWVVTGVYNNRREVFGK